MSAPKKLLRYQGDSFGQLLTVNDRKHNLSGDAVCSRGRHLVRARIVLARQLEASKSDQRIRHRVSLVLCLEAYLLQACLIFIGSAQAKPLCGLKTDCFKLAEWRSAMGQSRPNWAVRSMSGLPPIATELRTSLEVRFVPHRTFKSGPTTSARASVRTNAERNPPAVIQQAGRAACGRRRGPRRGSSASVFTHPRRPFRPPGAPTQ
jgi:hypothetical protein